MRVCRHHPPGLHRKLFWRVFGYGVGLILMVALSSMVVGYLLDVGPPWRGAAVRLTRALAADIDVERFDDAPPERRAQLERHLGALHEHLGADVALFRADGSRLAGAGAAVAPLDAEDLTSLQRGDAVQGSHSAWLAAGLGAGPPFAGYAVVVFPPPSHRPRTLIVFIGLALLVSALVMYPLARGIARPLETVAATARAIGGGDLSARTGIRRSDEVGQMAASFDEMADRVQALVRSEKELLANVSHELRTPLARLAVALELCEDETAPDVLHSHFAGMAEDVRELDHLVEAVLMAARLDLRGAGQVNAAGFALRRAPLHPGDVVSAAAARFAERHPSDRLDVHLPDGLPPLDGDAALLRRVLDNLLDNATKHGRLEGTAQVDLDARAESGSLVIELADRGPGVAPDDLPRLFEPFFQTDRSRSAARRGLGLGLTLSRRIVEAHGGTIDARVRDGGGLVVCVTLPLA